MLAVRLPSGELGAHDGDEGGGRIGKVVDGIQHDGDGMSQQADSGFKAGQKDIGKDADDAGTDDGFVALCGLVIDAQAVHFVAYALHKRPSVNPGFLWNKTGRCISQRPACYIASTSLMMYSLPVTRKVFSLLQ